MKLIKKIAAIMFAFMMVVSMSCNVKANEGASPETTGTLTINKVKEKQTYKLYKILDLESFSGDNYSYKVTAGWEEFFSTGEGKYYISINENNYAYWNTNEDAATYSAFAQKALVYATNKKITPVETFTTTTGQTTITKDSLDLGYYLLDSSVGTLCSLSSSQPNVTIDEKNDVPSVEKGVSNTQNGTFDTSSTASIGDTVYFKTTITAQPGAQNYVLHDKMTYGLTFNNKVEVKKGESPVATSYYTLKTSDFNDDCTFEIVFGQTFCDDLQKDEKITVTYSATLNENAVIAGEGNKNETWLKYGENNNLETTHPTTDTKTFEMHVFKFYKDKKNSDKETGLADAVFTLSKKSDGTEPIKLTKTNENSNIYKVNNNGTITDITTPGDGKFTIQGLGAGTYYLTEIKQPDGYNKLAKSVKVEIDVNGAITVDGKLITGVDKLVKVENKTGTVLPSTGGAGTTMIYLVGAVLVLGSGVVLATKRRVKNK